MTSVALVGPDGAGKTTVARWIVAALPGAIYRYCGTNPDMAPFALPTTRLAVRLRGGVSHGQPAHRAQAHSGARLVASWIRTFVWLSEELARGREVRRASCTSAVVVQDRDFLADRLAMPEVTSQLERIHRWVLTRWYPRPDLTVVLDVPSWVAFDRKRELDIPEIEMRRGGYLALGSYLPNVVVVDASKSPAEVANTVLHHIQRFTDGSRTYTR